MSKRSDLINVLLLILLMTALYCPVWTGHYLYTDEVVQLWYYGKKPDFGMFLPQGRYITEKLMQWLFGSVDTAEQVRYIRTFSFAGWLICVPAWYFILKDILLREMMPPVLALLASCYLVCTPAFTISVYWASCLELFLANTAGLLSGYCLYRSMRMDGSRLVLSSRLAWLSVLSGVVSLFTYQNGFGCFFIPFAVHLLSKGMKQRYIVVSIAGYLAIAGIYFLLFRYNLRSAGIAASDRTGFHFAPFEKMAFFLARPLRSSFSFTWLFNERDPRAFISYAIIAGGWVFMYMRDRAPAKLLKKAASLAVLGAMLMLVYLPGFIVKENYSSNRTLLALNMVVFLAVAVVLFSRFGRSKSRALLASFLALFFVANAWYNSRYLFLHPVRKEYAQLRNAIQRSYSEGSRVFYFIRPLEDFNERLYGITRSWDEFGVASSFFDWVPEFLVKQVVFEESGSRAEAERVVVKQWLGREAFVKSGEVLPGGAVLIDAERIVAGR